MMAENNSIQVDQIVAEAVIKCKELCDRCLKLSSTQGYQKLLRKCEAERKFLIKVSQSDDPLDRRLAQLKSSNIGHLTGIVNCAETQQNATAIIKPVSFLIGQDKVTLYIDVVSQDGSSWNKVIARNPQALHNIWEGETEFGQRDLVDQGEEYMECARQNPHHFVNPIVNFHCINGVTVPLAEALEAMGVVVHGTRVPAASGGSEEDSTSNATTDRDPELKMTGTNDRDVTSEINNKGSDNSVGGATLIHGPDNLDIGNDTTAPSQTTIQDSSHDASSVISNMCSTEIPAVINSAKGTCVNLDITCMIALVSSLTHGNCHLEFPDDPLLTEQASWERTEPILKLLNQFMQGKKWIACQTAVSDFQTILQTVGGCKEKERATHMLEHITIVSDTLSERASKLKCSGKLKQRAKVIFGTGDYHQAITVTANAGFVRAAENQGVSFAVFVHGSRALTEQKEISAIHLESDIHSNESLEHTNDASMDNCSTLIDKDVAS